MEIHVVERQLGFEVPAELKNTWTIQKLKAENRVFRLFNWSFFYLFRPEKILNIPAERRLKSFESLRMDAYASLRDGSISPRVFERYRTSLKQDTLVMSARISEQLEEPVLAFANCMWGDRQHYLIYRPNKKAYYLWAYREIYAQPIYMGAILGDFLAPEKLSINNFNELDFLQAYEDRFFLLTKANYLPELSLDELTALQNFYEKKAGIKFEYKQNDYFKAILKYLEAHNYKFNKQEKEERLYIINSSSFEALGLILLKEKEAAKLVQKGLIIPRFNKYIPEAAYHLLK